MGDNIILAAALGFGVGVLVFSGLAIYLCLFLLSRGVEIRVQVPRPAVPRPTIPTLGLSDKIVWLEPSLKHITIQDLVFATGSFSPDAIISKGISGFINLAELPGGLKVAVKKFDRVVFPKFREFQAEMDTLCNLRHPNIVKLLGYGISEGASVMVYENHEGGSLDQWLRSGDPDLEAQRLPLSWETRNRIVRGVANGLSYLHELDGPVIHRNITSRSVLLDSEYEAQIAEFAIARILDSSCSHVSTECAGQPGYSPPEYEAGLTVASVKGDVYSFGVLMLEIAAAKEPTCSFTLEAREVGFVEWARHMVKQSREMEMLDPDILREGLDADGVRKYFRIACMCTNKSARKRPCMVKVLELLNHISS